MQGFLIICFLFTVLFLFNSFFNVFLFLVGYRDEWLLSILPNNIAVCILAILIASFFLLNKIKNNKRT